ncbi:hypothetical protein JB92DRAFT_3104225 [Gautieria morchelliformis]|nr:hypothetical protein JB92DRAFT_3137522 [Gautieria morchelliformis]KAF8532152.1 hypothetical protein JB92DRAFT_3104225 [Gautieria morchelliformis]
MTPSTPVRATASSGRDNSPEEACPHGQLSSDPWSSRPCHNDDHRLSSDTGVGPRISAHTESRPDMDTFLDEDNHGFNSGMACAHFEQAAATFLDVDNPRPLFPVSADSSLGHFFKHSSASLGVQKVQHSCEQIQHLGERRGRRCIRATG